MIIRLYFQETRIMRFNLTASRPTVLILLIVTMAALLLAACGSSEESEPAPTPTEVPTLEATDTPMPPTDTPKPPTDTPETVEDATEEDASEEDASEEDASEETTTEETDTESSEEEAVEPADERQKRDEEWQTHRPTHQSGKTDQQERRKCEDQQLS